MEDKFWNISAQKAIYELTEMLQERQDKESRKTGFGDGFERWVYSYELRDRLNAIPERSHVFTYSEIRSIYKELANRGLIAILQRRDRGMLSYSTLGWEGCRNVGNYFIEDESIDSH